MRIAIAFATLLAASSSAHAYTYIKSGTFSGWPGTSTNLWYDPSIANNAGYLSALGDSLHAWDDGPQNFNVIGRELTVAYQFSNGRSEIAMIPHKADIGDVPGRTFWTFDSNGVLQEADILLAADWGFTTSNQKSDVKNYGGTKRSLRGVMIHELGHFFGLGHETDTYNIMGDDSTHVHANGSVVTWYGGEDATRGLIALYGSNGLQDVAVSHWHLCGSFGQYSSHCRNGMTDAAGNALTAYNDGANEPLFYVTRGQSYYPMATLENMGSSTETVTVRFVLSTNDTISTGDTTIATVSKTLTQDVVNESTGTRVTIPSTIAPGDYWLGAIVDADGAVPEWNESNNAGYLAKVRVQ